jgi:hypothetical protein
MNADVEGKVYPEIPFNVDPTRVAAFREIFGQATGVPPTFTTAAEFEVFPRIVGDPELGMDLRRLLHGSQEYALHRALVEGETLTVRSRLASIRSKGENTFLTIETELVGEDGEVACTARSTMIERGGTE